MRATRCLYKGFWGRSAEEFKRLSNIALNLEGIKGPSGPYELHSFRSPESVELCKAMSDEDIGGSSTAHLEWVKPEPPADGETQPHNPYGYARFYGTISTQLPRDRPDIKRTGYAGWRTQDRGPTLFGKSLWNIDPYTFLALRVKSDGRSYLVNVQTESVVPTDLHQHRLFCKRPGEWETVVIRWNDFVRTNLGVPGPFELCIERLWATNDPGESGDGDHVAFREGELKTKHGKKITWHDT
ncbi:hypothetical protein VTK73DRAFT_9559 [Phialemonium thermophilum]|uniref:NADH:ubiquinone oxidoreductase intermediate-associated protein 30 domain-containing protein n=1 Tax=Phialemonium thermophilum TaxID=223376 RepID=A0ABR3W1Q0_9PEZI